MPQHQKYDHFHAWLRNENRMCIKQNQMLRIQNRVFTGTLCMLIQEAVEPHDDHMATINTDSNYCSSITLKPYYSPHVSHETRDSDRNQLWILNGLGSNDFSLSKHETLVSQIWRNQVLSKYRRWYYTVSSPLNFSTLSPVYSQSPVCTPESSFSRDPRKRDY